ncbi:L-seryl-tRNA(Sec) kinase-like isoform X2 [Carassius auratus]|uniref:L-seryl-tRNA(Sec) kinase-like isoform X2 n=1 Tax=Carassius auratus TaxID=7957 RepID=A0A6P6L0B7_CARAU|nr:L-seryl-tRNA(Sec) kinase-like isoform X2 [Carassius auratus]
MSPAAACLCVLCGLPAAGKTRLARELRGRAQTRGWRTLLVTYDELIPARDWQESEWKWHRKTVIMCVERFLHQTLSDQTHTLSDGVGFCQVFLQCPLHVCLQRNRCRPQPVPDEVLLQMCERMEPPNEIRNPWEQQSLTLDSTEDIADGHIQKLMDLLVSALENPLSPVQDESQQKEADRRLCASSVLHQVDQTCRRLVSQTLTSARGQASPDVMKALAKALIELKTVFLKELKKDVLGRVSVFPEEPVDVEKLLMDVSAMFQRRSHEIVSKHM